MSEHDNLDFDKYILGLIKEQYGNDLHAMRELRSDLNFLNSIRKLCERSKIIAFTIGFTVIFTFVLGAFWHGILNQIGVQQNDHSTHRRD